MKERTQAEKSRLKTAPTAVESLMAQGVNAIDMIVRGRVQTESRQFPSH